MPAPRTQSLPGTITLMYAYWDGTDLLAALPVTRTPHSQVSDWIVWDQAGNPSLKTSVRHQSSGDANYWYFNSANQTS